MRFTLSRLRELLDNEGLQYYLMPEHEGVMLNFRGDNARHQLIVLVEEDGEFLQFRSLEYLSCPANHPNLQATLKVLGECNYRLRAVKFGWDPRDGEIAVYVDLWVMDAEITREQFKRIVDGYFTIMDDQHPRIKAAIDYGICPDIDAMERGEEPGASTESP